MFSESDRKIFGPYFDGEQLVYADPLRVDRRLRHELGDVNAALQQAKGEDPEARYAARERLLAAGRLSLDMAPFDPSSGRGALEADVWAALNAFIDWLEKKNLSPQNSPTYVPPTVPPASSDPDPFAGLTGMPFTSDSPSPSPDCGCGGPGK